ncbi:hypothetical protein EDD11_004043 [Mortierella claussenii]|nr:hypothetical protein EDD11_004043 [Mortierella claussenii]
MKKSRITQSKVILLICIASMVMALAHIHYSNVYRQEREEQANSHLTHNNTEPTPSNIETSLEHNLPITSPPPPSRPGSRPETDDTVPPPISDFTLTDTPLTTTFHYQNGTINKEFKPTFYKDPMAARKEMGSFLETLAKRSWWERPSSIEATVKAVPPTNTFFSYLPMGGGNNQFTSLQKAALLAKDLKRTLIIPPISPNSHIKIWAGPRYSEFYDLESFSALTGLPVLEWHDIKQTPSTPTNELTHHWADFGEDFPCVPNSGIGVDDKNLYDHFRTQFLLNFHSVAPEAGPDTTLGKSGDYSYARDVLLKDKNKDHPEAWKCLSCPYFLGGADLSDRAWNEVGLHLKFNQKIEEMADQILDVLLPRSEKDLQKDSSSSDGKQNRRYPEFIIVHLRRGDIVTKCKPGQAEKDCIVQIEEIAEKVDEIEKQRRIKALAETEKSNNDAGDGLVLERLPVLVTTNEKRIEELEKLDKLGWIMLDHGDVEMDAQGKEIPSKTKKLGTMTALGPFYPPMLDAVLLTRGDYLIGMANSRMSQLATQRGAAWHGHTTMLM